MRVIPDDVLAALTIWMEARGEPAEGKLAVAHVIRNRLRTKFMADGTVAGTVLRPFQFSCWNTKDPNRIVAAKLDDQDGQYKESLLAWRDSAVLMSNVGKARFYLNPAIVNPLPSWASKEKFVATIGHHSFYEA